MVEERKKGRGGEGWRDDSRCFEVWVGLEDLLCHNWRECREWKITFGLSSWLMV